MLESSADRSKPLSQSRYVSGGIAIALFFISLPVLADYVVASNSTTSIASAQFDLGCTNLIVDGTLNLDTGKFINVHNITIASGGVINGDTGLIEYSGSFSNSGTFTNSSNFLSNSSCTSGGQGGQGGKALTPVPTLGNEMLIILAAVLASLGTLIIRGGTARRRRNTMKGAGK